MPCRLPPRQLKTAGAFGATATSRTDAGAAIALDRLLRYISKLKRIRGCGICSSRPLARARFLAPLRRVQGHCWGGTTPVLARPRHVQPAFWPPPAAWLAVARAGVHSRHLVRRMRQCAASQGSSSGRYAAAVESGCGHAPFSEGGCGRRPAKGSVEEVHCMRGGRTKGCTGKGAGAGEPRTRRARAHARRPATRGACQLECGSRRAHGSGGRRAAAALISRPACPRAPLRSSACSLCGAGCPRPRTRREGRRRRPPST